MTTPTAVARAVARDAEQRARSALKDVLTAHTELRAADTALATATQAQADAGPALVRAIAAARDVGITTEQLAELGLTAPPARTLRRRRPRTSPPDPVRPADTPADGHPVLGVVDTEPPPEAATSNPQPWPPQDTGGGHPGAHDSGHTPNAEAARTW